MLDPINPNQNQQNVDPNNVQPQAQAQTQTPVDDTTQSNVSSGKPELGPVNDNVSIENQQIENQPIVESSGEFADPNVGGEVKDIIKVKKDFPDLDSGAKASGVSETLPSGSVYGNFPPTLQAAQVDYKEKSATSADKWRALEKIKELGRNLFGQPKSVEA